MKKINRKAAYELNTEELNYYTKQIEKKLREKKTSYHNKARKLDISN